VIGLFVAFVWICIESLSLAAIGSFAAPTGVLLVHSKFNISSNATQWKKCGLEPLRGPRLSSRLSTMDPLDVEWLWLHLSDCEYQ
jgi:hypothetical protein